MPILRVLEFGVQRVQLASCFRERHVDRVKHPRLLPQLLSRILGRLRFPFQRVIEHFNLVLERSSLGLKSSNGFVGIHSSLFGCLRLGSISFDQFTDRVFQSSGIRPGIRQLLLQFGCVSFRFPCACFRSFDGGFSSFRGHFRSLSGFNCTSGFTRIRDFRSLQVGCRRLLGFGDALFHLCEARRELVETPLNVQRVLFDLCGTLLGLERPLLSRFGTLVGMVNLLPRERQFSLYLQCIERLRRRRSWSVSRFGGLHHVLKRRKRIDVAGGFSQVFRIR